ncbi:hypothetical protein SKAU_G00025160 [Synaphobranchus kaupii]|uniref:Phosphatidylinositol-4-phosphate 3-kinase n=1 Tax=Synaphobranchus kaupii TaxID=118154 RepID=A0A9Q1GDS9_SYNKA|nr:hypothetical protein SKAU_G00025160 [Synaphobranchus kaupii]
MDTSQSDCWPTEGDNSSIPMPLSASEEDQLALLLGLDIPALMDADDLDLYNSLPVPLQPEPQTQPPPPPLPPRNSIPRSDADPLETAGCVATNQTVESGNPKEAMSTVPPPVPPRRRPASTNRSDRPLSCDVTNPGNKFSRSNTAPIHNPWTIKLKDTPEGSNERLAAFLSKLRSKYPHTDRTMDTGVVWGRLCPVHPFLSQNAQLTVTVSTPWLPHAIPFPTTERIACCKDGMDLDLYSGILVNRAVQSLIDEIVLLIGVSSGSSSQYLLKLSDSEEFLRNHEILGAYESIQAYLKFKMVVPVRLVLQSTLDSLMSRDDADDTHQFNLNSLLDSYYIFSKSRVRLEDKLSSYSKEVNQLMRSQCGSNVSHIVEVVRNICSLLCGLSIKEVEDAIGQLNRIKPTMLSPSEMCDCETAVIMLHQALVRLLHIFFDNFNSDVRLQEICPSPPTADVNQNIDILQVDLVALYKLQISWLNSFDYFCMSCALMHCGTELCEVGVSENISTVRALDNNIQCNRMIVFPVQIRDLPYESMLMFRLRGSKQGKTPELLCWAVLPLYSNRTLASGTVLLSMSTLIELTDPPTSAVSDGHRQATGVILQVEFSNSHRWKYERPKPLLNSSNSRFFTPPCEELHKKITVVSKRHCLSFLTENEKAFMWGRRHYCNEENSKLHLILGSAPQWQPQDLEEIYTVLEHWFLQRPEEILFLLSDSFQDQNVRRVAVQGLEQLSDAEIEDYLPQLVQALKIEWELDGPLVMFLLDRSVRSIRVAQQLHWLIKDALEDVPYRSWFCKLHAALKYCCGTELRQELEREESLVSLLTQVAEKIRLADKTKRTEVLKREKLKIEDFFKGGVMCRLPLDPAVLVKGVDIDACKIYNSNAAPLAVPFINADSLGRNISVICKTGDNLRQDMVMLQVVRLMDRVWLQEGLDMRMVTYRCLPTGRDQGLVEVVPEAVTLGKIHQEWGLGGTLREDSLEKWFHMWNKTEEDYEEAVMNFLHSCAGWCVATFILGICDRHNDNIMLKHSGHMFHIDFGKIMGNAQKIANIKRDRSPFIFTSEMLHFITGGGQMPQRFHKFVELCCEAYNGIRRRSALILSLLKLMLGAGMPELKDTQDLKYVYNNLRPQDSDLEATEYFTRKISESLSSFPVKINFILHTMAQNSSAKCPEPPKQAQTATQNTNIQEVVIQKYTTHGKELMFEMSVTIEDGFLISEKTFSQFEMIHRELQKHFIKSSLPQFPSRYMSITARSKMSVLNKYLQELFAGPCKGNEFVCSLFLDGPRIATTMRSSKKDSASQTSPQIQLYMSHKDNKLLVMVKHLKNIRLHSGSCPDTYVVTRLLPDPCDLSRKKTRVIRSENPSFNELIEYTDVPSLSGRILELTVKSKKVIIAAINVQLDDSWMETEVWFPLGKSTV